MHFLIHTKKFNSRFFFQFFCFYFILVETQWDRLPSPYRIRSDPSIHPHPLPMFLSHSWFFSLFPFNCLHSLITVRIWEFWVLSFLFWFGLDSIDSLTVRYSDSTNSIYFNGWLIGYLLKCRSIYTSVYLIVYISVSCLYTVYICIWNSY